MSLPASMAHDRRTGSNHDNKAFSISDFVVYLEHHDSKVLLNVDCQQMVCRKPGDLTSVLDGKKLVDGTVDDSGLKVATGTLSEVVDGSLDLSSVVEEPSSIRLFGDPC